MKGDHSDLADDLFDPKIDLKLEPGESILWEGVPCSRLRLVRHELGRHIRFLGFLIILSFWAPFVAIGGHNNWDRGKVVPRFATHNLCIAGMAMAAGLAGCRPVFAGVYRSWNASSHLRYVLTDRRAILWAPSRFWGETTRCYSANSIRSRKIRPNREEWPYHPVCGDILFERNNPPQPTGKQWPDGFIAVPDLHGLDRKIWASFGGD